MPIAEVFQLSGSYTTAPSLGSPSGQPALATPIDETMTLLHKQESSYDLSSDAPASVNFGGVSSANVVAVKVVGGKVKVRMTSSDGSAQAVPCDSFMVLMSGTVGISAIDLTRSPGVNMTVTVFLGERAS